MERKSRTAIIGLLLLLMINTYSISAGKKPSGRQNREDTLRINALEFEEIDITKVKGMNAPDDVTVVLDNDTLKFEFNSDKINPKYYGILRNLIEYINVNNYRVTVVGHTDSKGTNAYNMKLGMRRAENAKKKLLELGLSADKIAGVESRGEEEPVATNDTAAGRALNRRIEFKLQK
jgi:outer membrane protein